MASPAPPNRPTHPRPSLPNLTGRWSYTLTVLSALALVVFVGLTRTSYPFDLSNLVFDWFQRIEQRTWDPQSPVRIIDIDNESLGRIGQWPWPRSTIADMIGRLRDLDAAVVALDIVFAEPDGLSPERLVALLPDSPGRALVEQEIKDRTPNDAVLAKTVGEFPTVLGAFLTQDNSAVDFPTKFGLATAGDDPRLFLARFSSAVVSLPLLTAAAAGIGAANWLPDRDQIVRRVPLLLALGDKVVPSLALKSLRVGQGASTFIVRASNASGETAFGAQSGINSIKVGDLEIPTDAQAAVRVNYTRSEPRRFIPAWKLLAGEVGRDEIQQRIVVIGTSAAGLRDERSTPVDIAVPGSEIHAQVLEQILAGAWLSRPDWAPGLELLLAVGLVLAFGTLLPRIGPVAGVLAAAVAIAILLWASRHQFQTSGVLVDPLLPSLAVLTAYVFCVVWLYRAEQRRRQFVREAFGRYVSPSVVERLAEDPHKLVLGGETRTVTIMFCDVRGFTAMAERLDAQSLTLFMNEYLTAMTDAILTHGGTIDKYIGDAIMAFWNAPLDDPNHARHAAMAAMAMMRALESLNQQWQARAQASGDPHSEVKFGIGLATGDCCVGNFGSLNRFNYSVLGDHVNLASRLEAATKYYGTSILASEPTRDLAADLAWIEIDRVRVKGKTQVARIFALAGDEHAADFPALAEVHGRMLTAYRCKDFAAALALARQAQGTSSPWLRELYAYYERRCGDLERAPADDWVPITEFDWK